MKLTGENLEYTISQYVDGTLSEIDRRALEEQLVADAEARLHVTHEAHLTNLLREYAVVDQPAVDFDSFQAHLSSVIADEPSHLAQPIRMTTVWVRRLSIAAAVGIAALVGVKFIPQTGDSTRPVGTVIVAGPAIETSNSPADINIAVGPSDALIKRGQTLSMADDSIFTPAPRVVISSGAGTGQIAMDSGQPLY